MSPVSFSIRFSLILSKLLKERFPGTVEIEFITAPSTTLLVLTLLLLKIILLLSKSILCSLSQQCIAKALFLSLNLIAFLCSDKRLSSCLPVSPTYERSQFLQLMTYTPGFVSLLLSLILFLHTHLRMVLLKWNTNL